MRSALLLYSLFLILPVFPKAQVDSLGYMLKSLQNEKVDEALVKVSSEAEMLYRTGGLTDSLSKKLLQVAELLSNSSIERLKIIRFLRISTEALRQIPPEGAHLNYAYGLDWLAGFYERSGGFNIALSIYTDALRIKGKILGEDHLHYAANLNNLANVYSQWGRYDKALPIYHQELDIKRTRLGEQHYAYVNCLLQLSWTYFHLGYEDTALLLNQNILLIIKKMEKATSPGLAYILMNLARLYHRMGQSYRSIILYDQALSVKKASFGENDFEYAIALIDVGYFHHSIMGNYVKAVQLYNEALPIMEEKIAREDASGNRNFQRVKFLYRLNLSHLGTAFSLMGIYDSALHYYQKALHLFPQVPDCMINLAELYFSLGNYDSTRAMCDRLAFYLEKNRQNTFDFGRNQNNLAFLFYKMHNYQAAFQLFDNYSRIIRETWGTDNLHYANSLISLGMANNVLGNDTKATVLFDEALRTSLNCLTRTYGSLSEQEKIAILKKNSAQFDFLPSLLYTGTTEGSTLAKILYENILSLKGMVLEDQKATLSSIRKSGDSVLLQTYLRWRAHKSFVGAQQLLPFAKRVPYLDSLENITNQLEQYLSGQSTMFKQQRRNACTAGTISQKLSADEAAIEFIRFRLFNKKWTDSILYAALVLLPEDSFPRFVPLFEEKQLQRLLRPYAGSTTRHPYVQRLYGPGIKPGSNSEKNMNDSLFQLVWRPIENYLAGIKTIYYSPAGLLHRIAFTALPRDKDHHLMDNYLLKQVLSTRSIDSVDVDDERWNRPSVVSLWGHIDYESMYNGKAAYNIPEHKTDNGSATESSFNLYTDDTRGERQRGWSPLPNAKKEIDLISKTLTESFVPISVFSGQRATEEAFKAVDGKSPMVLHLATHGFFFATNENQISTNEHPGENNFTVQQNPMFRSGLVLAGGNHTWTGGTIPPNREDGIITAYEIAQLDLSNTQLLFLSACETALGDLKYGNEGVVGLQRAFKLAGVKTMIMSLWEVPDKQTVELTILFYENWLGGQSIRKALHNAQMRMKQKYSPFYWAAFVVVE